MGGYETNEKSGKHGGRCEGNEDFHDWGGNDGDIHVNESILNQNEPDLSHEGQVEGDYRVENIDDEVRSENTIVWTYDDIGDVVESDSGAEGSLDVTESMKKMMINSLIAVMQMLRMQLCLMMRVNQSLQLEK